MVRGRRVDGAAELVRNEGEPTASGLVPKGATGRRSSDSDRGADRVRAALSRGRRTQAEEEPLVLASGFRTMSPAEEEELVDALAELLLERLRRFSGRRSAPSGARALLAGSGPEEER